jgi:hypothetical protein
MMTRIIGTTYPGPNLMFGGVGVREVWARGEIPNIRIMYNDIEHSISIDFYIYISIFQVFYTIY